MALKLLKQFVLLSFCMTAFSCGSKDSVDSGRGDIDVQIPVSVKRDENGDTNGSAFTYQIVKLLNVFSLNKVRGKFARFYLNPSVENNRLTGIFPEAHFLKNKNNVYTPTDDMSSEMASIYYHVQNMALFDEKLGVGTINKLPRDIGLDVKYKSSKSSSSFESNNVLYEGNYDAIIFAPNDNDKLPIAINGGIIAHEHFHSLFHKLVMIKLLKENIVPKEVVLTTHYIEDEEKKEKIQVISDDLKKNFDLTSDQLRDFYNLVLLKGLNEGLADFWGWVYTNDDNFIIHSLPEVGSDRTLKIKEDELKNLTIPTRSQIIANLKVFAQQKELFEANLNSYSYDLGTQFARALKAFVQKRMQHHKMKLDNAKEGVAKSVVSFLSHLADEFKNNAKQKFIDPNELAIRMIVGVENLALEECEAVMRVLVRSKDLEKERKCKTEKGKVVVQ